MATQERFLWEGVVYLLRHDGISFVAKLLNDFMSWRRIKNIVLDWNILIVKLVQESQGRNVFPLRSIPNLTELLSDSLHY